MKIKIKRFDENISLPEYEKGAAGFDFLCRTNTVIKPNEIRGIPSNVALVVPKGYLLLVLSRSSTPTHTGLVMPHSVGIIDPFFCGDDDEIQLIFKNTTNKSISIKKGAKLAQGVLIKYETAEFVEVKKLKKLKRKKFNYEKS